MEKPVLKNEIEAKISGVAKVEDNIAEAKEYALQLKEYYSKLIFTDDQLSEAKDERISINKVIKKIADYRKEIIAEFKKPIETFENTAKETEKILKETADFVDVQVKNFENNQKNKKKEEIIQIFNNLIEEKSLNDLISFEMIFDERYLNKTYLIEQVNKDLNEKLQKISNDIQAIRDLNSEYEVSLINNYLENFDLGLVISENKRLYELKEKSQKVANKQDEVKKEQVNEMLSKEVKTEEIDPIKKYILEIEGPLSKQIALKKFLELNNMKFKRIN